MENIMQIVDKTNFKMYVHIGECKSPSDTKVVHFIREEYDEKADLILRNTYEFFMTKDEIKKLARVFNDYE
jgi:hypothetical protein